MRTHCSGQAPIEALFWIVRVGLLALPFLRTQSGLDPEGDDPGRAVSELDVPFAEDARNWSMPDFRLLSEEKRWDLVEYVRYLSMRGEFEQLALDLAWEEEEAPDFAEVEELVMERWDRDALRPTYPPIPEPDADAASVARGRELYLDQTTAARRRAPPPRTSRASKRTRRPTVPRMELP